MCTQKSSRIAYRTHKRRFDFSFFMLTTTTACIAGKKTTVDNNVTKECHQRNGLLLKIHDGNKSLHCWSIIVAKTIPIFRAVPLSFYWWCHILFQVPIVPVYYSSTLSCKHDKNIGPLAMESWSLNFGWYHEIIVRKIIRFDGIELRRKYVWFPSHHIPMCIVFNIVVVQHNYVIFYTEQNDDYILLTWRNYKFKYYKFPNLKNY